MGRFDWISKVAYIVLIKSFLLRFLTPLKV